MKFTASHVELDQVDSWLMNRSGRHVYEWGEMPLLKTIVRIELEAEVARECDYITSVCEDIDIAMLSTAHRPFKTGGLANLILKLEGCAELYDKSSGIVR